MKNPLRSVIVLVFGALGVFVSVGARGAEEGSRCVEATPLEEGVSGEATQPLVTAPPGCVYERTQTKCYVLVKFCDELYRCPDGSEWWRGWEECGTCSIF